MRIGDWPLLPQQSCPHITPVTPTHAPYPTPWGCWKVWRLKQPWEKWDRRLQALVLLPCQPCMRLVASETWPPRAPSFLRFRHCLVRLSCLWPVKTLAQNYNFWCSQCMRQWTFGLHRGSNKQNKEKTKYLDKMLAPCLRGRAKILIVDQCGLHLNRDVWGIDIHGRKTYHSLDILDILEILDVLHILIHLHW